VRAEVARSYLPMLRTCTYSLKTVTPYAAGEDIMNAVMAGDLEAVAESKLEGRDRQALDLCRRWLPPTPSYSDKLAKSADRWMSERYYSDPIPYGHPLAVPGAWRRVMPQLSRPRHATDGSIAAQAAVAEGPMEVWMQSDQAQVDGVEDLGPEGGREHLLLNPLKLAGTRGEKSINPMLAFELMDAVDKEAKASGVMDAMGDRLSVERIVQDSLPLDVVGGKDLLGREQEMIRDVDMHKSLVMVESSPSESARVAVEEEVARWGTADRYMHHIAYLGTRLGGGAKQELFRVKFSTPTKSKPIPLVVVDVYFYAVKGDGDEVVGLYYHFELDDLVLSRDHPRPVNNLERIDKTMHAKTLTRSLLDTRTEFELTRVSKDGSAVPDEEPLVEEEDDDADATSESSLGGNSSNTSWAVNIDASGEGTRSSVTLLGSTADCSIMSRYPDSPKRRATGNLQELFRHMFEAVDEDGIGQLTHREVADILEATLGRIQRLKRWDVKTLLAAAEEGED
ncbi:hypothetical protein FOZ63_000283, partial [Perkinsus olseni]